MGSKLYTRGERIFKWVSLVLLLVICVATLAPFVLILASSLTDETTLITYGYSFWPQKFSMGQLPVHVEPAQTDWSLLFDLPGHYGGGYRG